MSRYGAVDPQLSGVTVAQSWQFHRETIWKLAAAHATAGRFSYARAWEKQLGNLEYPSVGHRGSSNYARARARERRFKPTLVGPPIELDDYRRAMDELLPTVSTSVAAHRARVEEMFLKRSADRFVPVPG
jgi:hypothetical protein